MDCRSNKKLNCVLLIDDDNINNFINERLIRKTNITDEIRIVLNGKEAIDYLTARQLHERKKSPELILLDINMPVMDGFEFLEAYKRLELYDKESVIIVMLTTSANPSDTKRLDDSGVAGYINKPLTESKLKEVMDYYFEQVSVS